MSQSHIPQGCYSVKSAAEKLNICPTSVLKKMQWRGWLHKGSFRNDPLKNMPLQQAIDEGFIQKIKRKAPAPHDWEIAVTKKGLEELGAPMQPSPTPKPLNEESAQQVKQQSSSTAANEEREKAMEQMRSWGIAS